MLAWVRFEGWGSIEVEGSWGLALQLVYFLDSRVVRLLLHLKIFDSFASAFVTP